MKYKRQVIDEIKKKRKPSSVPLVFEDTFFCLSNKQRFKYGFPKVRTVQGT